MKIQHKSTFHPPVQGRSGAGRDGLQAGHEDEEPTLRGELFSAEQMELHGVLLARRHRLSPRSTSDRLLRRLDDNDGVLAEACEALTAASQANRRVPPAGEWLLDNYYLVEEQIRIAQRHLPRGYNRELPRLADGATEGWPRVYALALEIISHGDGRVDDDSLGRFISAYQGIQPLTLGELWAIPIMLRLALIENLRRVAARVIADAGHREVAGRWADTITEIAEHDLKSVVIGVADMARSNPPMASAFVAELARRLQGQGPGLAMPLSWLEQRLAESGSSVAHQVQIEAQQQAADQVSISNSIGSLRHLAAVDWHAFVERLSVVETLLRSDPAGIHAEMDFATRDHYRHVIENLARRSGRSEPDVAQCALALAHRAAAVEPVPGIEAHVGYYLIDDGRAELERVVKLRFGPLARLGRRVARKPLPAYLGMIALLCVLMAQPLLAAMVENHAPLWAQLLLALPALLVVSQLATGLVNWTVTVFAPPAVLPRMDFSAGIPVQSRTLVVIPTLFGSLHDVDELVDALEVRYLANRDVHLHFGLLSDFTDAASETTPLDAALLARASARIEALNVTYAGGAADRFFLFHRPRVYHAPDRVWMGRERKRGKLGDLNTLLRGSGRERFSLIVGDVAALRGVTYVITLDSDTELPRDSARRFASAMAHPLNRPVYDAALGRVVRGYGILQPRLGVSLPSAARSRYAQLFGSEAGIDPYTRAVSDVYQDLFGEGSFIGKGIYDVDAFQQALEHRFPDNTILSHDLIEGAYARAGLLSDVQLYEPYPSGYLDDSQRRHRWIRGDWQILPWLLPRAPGPHGWVRNPLSALSRWKILDNLRRSLVPAAFVLLLVVGWLGVAQVVSWTIAILGLVVLLPVLGALLVLVQKSPDVEWRAHLQLALRASVAQGLRAGFWVMTLPHEALYSLDAVLRSLWRMTVSRRLLLQWRPSRDCRLQARGTPAQVLRQMWINPALALAGAVALAVFRLPALPVAAPLLALWALAPGLVWLSGQPRRREVFVPSAAQQRFLRMLARRIWGFFEVHVGTHDNALPPDNMQEHPTEVIAHRTSPTNIGLALLSNLAAYDFGYITVGRLLQRTADTLHTMQGLARYRGHFYNWYDTVSLQPLAPQYVSTVDSGNLAGHLLTLRPGLLALMDAPVFHPRLLDGLADTLEVLVESRPQDDRLVSACDALMHRLDDARAAPPTTVTQARDVLRPIHAGVMAMSLHFPANALDEPTHWYGRLVEQVRDVMGELDYLAGASPTDELPTLRQLAVAAPAANTDSVADRAGARITELRQLAELAGEMAVMDFSFLYDRRRDLLSIGYNVDERRLDAGFYDLLASEARLANYVAIAQGQLPQEGWFTLGRLLTTTTRGRPVLLSWTGSMFEYLMPMLVMPSIEGTLLDETCRAAVARQIEYGQQLGVPWGVSESGYNTVDVQLNYQYRAFGVPGLGLKRGLGDDLVVAPYASTMALMVSPAAACANLERLAHEDRLGRFGFYEAIDYTPARLPNGQSAVVVRSFMAHHQGMSLLSLAHALLDQPMQKRFEADPQFRASALLLQERVPETAAEYRHATGFPIQPEDAAAAEGTLRVFTDPDMPRPAVQLLSNGSYHVMVSSGGGSYSRRRDMAVTRWQEDISSDHWGQFCYLRDVETGEFWSTAHQPTLHRPEHFEAIFSDARAEFRVRERDYDAHTEIVVSPEDDIELRRVRLTNRGRTARTIEITTYAEVVIAPAAADAAHPAFSNLFVQTAWLPAAQALICTRRPRSATEAVPWMCHLMAVHDARVESLSYETDRAAFIGRGRSLARPRALVDRLQAQLGNSVDSVLDPIVAIRCRITLAPEQSATIDIVTGVADSDEACRHLAEKYRDRHIADRVFDLAWTHSQVLLQQLNAGPGDARLYERMAASIIYANTSLRAEPGVLQANRRGQSGLWGQAISGDLPIVLLRMSDPGNIELVRQLVQAHAYWRLKGLAVDLVIWNEDQAGYRQQLHDLIMGLIASGTEASLIDRPGGIFVRPAQQLSVEDRVLVRSVARVVLSDTRGSLAEQLERRRVEPPLPRFDPTRIRTPELVTPAAVPDARLATLQLANAYGGFSADGSEYVVVLQPGRPTPAPWCNVLANPGFGCVISESGGACTWSENAHEFRLTPWHNDPVTDASGEAIYLRDEESGHCWSPTPLPRRGTGRYVTRHGFGYSVFEHVEDGIESELWVYVALHAPVKFSVLRLRNTTRQPRRLSATGYVEWVLGDLRAKSAMHVVTESDPTTGALFARNAYHMDFGGRVAFFDVDGGARSVTGDRREFLGRNGNMRAPAAMGRSGLSGRLGPGLDPCAAIQLPFELAPGETREVVFRLGAAHDEAGASELVQRFRGSAAAAAALDEVRMHWHWTLGKVQVRTHDPAVDVLANGWLMYQVIASRFWARSGYYQSGGAFGFRDQLQDTMAMIHASPYSARQHLLLSAAHQFVEGDVQHWWHPPTDRGVRTHCSDDYLWLALATSHYVHTTADTGVLDERVGYLEGRPVKREEESYYDLPTRSEQSATLYEHCVRAIEHSRARGPHGLPLIGTGDWNDGMNRVGELGQGESIWLGFFLHEVLNRFAGTARQHGDNRFAELCEVEAATLRTALETHGWDGAWYRRAYFDDGTPLGSSGNVECRIDSIAQSWSVLSSAAPDARRRQAMESLDTHLVKRRAGLIQLLEPPFDRSDLDPGYIKGYVPGVRENGGQYTHAAVWATMAFAALGDGARAWELLGMINPVNHGSGTGDIEVYKVEPYVVAADVYGVAPHQGRGGWSWYTGSAGWMYRLIVESLLGLRIEGETMRVTPVLSPGWTAYELAYRHRETDYLITVRPGELPGAPTRIKVNDVPIEGDVVALVDDGGEHRIEIAV
ncbi:MAG TPA: glucoamylase family protein [Dyella sp.]|nr:glucoamylase family protein [Dyella sp.]